MAERPSPRPAAGPPSPYVNQVGPDGKFLPPRAPPPPRRAIPYPRLPDLPALGSQARLTTRPPPSTPLHPCGSVLVGTRTIPLDCIDHEYGRIEHASAPLVSYDVLHGADIVFPAVVDHRADGTEGPVRDQGHAPTCTAFSLATAVEHSVNRWTGTTPKVSVMQLWARYHIGKMSRSEATNIEQPISSEGDWPYVEDSAFSWTDPSTCAAERLPSNRCGQAVDLGKLQLVDKRPVAEIRDVAQLDDPRDFRAMKAKIALGQDVWISLRAGEHLSCSPAHCGLTGVPGSRYVVDYTQTQPGGHATVVSGYATFPHGTYFLLHNSWGAAWGDNGYAWIHETTLRKNITYAYVIDAHPADATTASRARRVPGHVVCAAGLAPDSISNVCVPLCSDGSPRHNAVCPLASQCPAGEVNLTGVCVGAAPQKSGVDPRTLVSWKCAPGGCVYTVPTGVGACDRGPCSIACPAPDYRLGNGRRGLTCME